MNSVLYRVELKEQWHGVSKATLLISKNIPTITQSDPNPYNHVVIHVIRIIMVRNIRGQVHIAQQSRPTDIMLEDAYQIIVKSYS